MIPNEVSGEELRFSPDFFARVMHEADTVVAGRRRVKRVAVPIAAIVLTGAIAFGISTVLPTQKPAPASGSAVLARIDVGAISPVRASQTEPLDYMFPDAGPLARFADEYSNAANGAVADRQAILFAGEAEEAGGTN